MAFNCQFNIGNSFGNIYSSNNIRHLKGGWSKKPMSFALEVIIFGLATCTTLVILMIITLILNYLARLATKKYNAGFRLLLCCIIVIALAEIFPVTGQKKYPFNSVSFILDLFCVTSTYFLSCLVNFNFLEVEE